MKLLALSVLLMLACAAFGKAVDEVPVQEKDDTAVPVQEEDDTAVEDFELTGEEQAEDDSNAVMESNTEAEGRKRCKFTCKYVPKKICRRIKWYRRHCSIVYKRICRHNCYYYG